MKIDEAATFIYLHFIQVVQLMTRRKCSSCLSLSEPNRLIHLRNINFSLFYRVATDKLIFFPPQTNLFFISILLFARFGEEKKKKRNRTHNPISLRKPLVIYWCSTLTSTTHIHLIIQVAIKSGKHFCNTVITGDSQFVGFALTLLKKTFN